MNRTLIATLVIALSPLVSTGQDQKNSANKALNGNWIIESAVRNGKQIDALKGSSLTFKDGTLTLKTKGRVEVVTYKLDPKQKPMHLTFKNKKDEIVKGIIEIKGNTVRLCFDKEGEVRPKTFDDANKSPATLMNLKKAE